MRYIFVINVIKVFRFSDRKASLRKFSLQIEIPDATKIPNVTYLILPIQTRVDTTDIAEVAFACLS